MQVSTSVDYWDEVGKKFYTKYKGVDECHNRWQKEAMETGTIKSPFGIEWVIPFNPKKIPWTIITNYPNQGLGAEVMKLARVSFYRRLKKQPFFNNVKLISTVHDSIVVDLPNELVMDVAKMFHEVFKDLPLNFKKCYNYDWLVPLDCECKVGPNQLEQEKLKLL